MYLKLGLLLVFNILTLVNIVGQNSNKLSIGTNETLNVNIGIIRSMRKIDVGFDLGIGYANFVDGFGLTNYNFKRYSTALTLIKPFGPKLKKNDEELFYGKFGINLNWFLAKNQIVVDFYPFLRGGVEYEIWNNIGITAGVGMFFKASQNRTGLKQEWGKRFFEAWEIGVFYRILGRT